MRGRVIERLVLAGVSLFVLLAPGIAAAQVQVTPNFSDTPTKTVTPWVYQMAIGALIIGVLALLGIGVAYLRFAPAFFGRREATPRPVPGARPALLTQPAARPSPAAPAQTAPVPARTQGGAAAVAVAERPAPAAAPADASAQPTAGPVSEPAVQADAVGEAEAAAPGEAPAPAVAAPAPAAAPAASASHGAQLDQETFDRVLEEQLAKGVDRRVAEGRARAAAVVAARKKAQG